MAIEEDMLVMVGVLIVNIADGLVIPWKLTTPCMGFLIRKQMQQKRKNQNSGFLIKSNSQAQSSSLSNVTCISQFVEGQGLWIIDLDASDHIYHLNFLTSLVWPMGPKLSLKE